ncbi:hypothetical protein HPB47_008884 [Ixodes persulcatus]|uniref:Uncharacterized protein n=1 Tax=Ixodes persulcatus TaxID=34615 RepID=A0AC60P3G8_IXOPE|nr:hypothetical protein HPB47_008884 [Ixodes persulcatus]
MKILECVKCGQESKTAIAKRHGIPKCTLSRILKDGDKIEKAYNSGAFAPGKKRMRPATHKGLEKVLFLWFKACPKLQPSSDWAYFGEGKRNRTPDGH